MNAYYITVLLFLFGKTFGFKANHQVDRQSKSIFSNKKYTEKITPARYMVGQQNIKYEQPPEVQYVPEQYFPAVEYPTNIMETSKPFFYNGGENNAMLGPFSDDVKTSFKYLMEKNKKSLDEMKVKYNEYNSRKYYKDIVNPTPSFIETVSTSDSSKGLVNEMVEEFVEELQQNEPAVVEDVVEEEAIDKDVVEDEAIDKDVVEDKAIDTYESEETTNQEDTDAVTDVQEFSENEDVAKEEEVEEETVAETFQSWESEQVFSSEIADEEVAEEIGKEEPEELTQEVTEVEILDDSVIEEEMQDEISESSVEELVADSTDKEIVETDTSTTVVKLIEEKEADEIETESSEPQNPDDVLCPAPPEKMDDNDNECDKKLRLNNMKLMQKMRKSNFLKRKQAANIPNLNFCKKVQGATTATGLKQTELSERT